MVAEAKLRKWGNSFGIRIPNEFIKKLDITQDTKMILRIVDDKLLLERQENLKDLCQAISETNLNTQNNSIESRGVEW